MAHVWIVNQYAITPDLPGGSRHIDLGRELVKKGHQVSIFASDVNLSLRKHTRLNPGEEYQLVEVDGVHFYWLRAAVYQKNDWRRAWNMLSFAWSFLRKAARLAAPPDVIIGSSPHPFAALAAWWVAKRAGVPFWLELRDLWPQALVDMGGFPEWHPGIRLMRMLERFLYARASRIIILAQGSLKYLTAKGVPGEKVIFLPNGVRLADFPEAITKMANQKAREEARKQFDMKGFTIVYTGAHGPANALDTILDTARVLRVNRPSSTIGQDVNFLLVGDGPAKVRLIEKARALELENVRFLAPVPKTRIPALLMAADATVITLKDVAAFQYAVSPNKLFDYLAAGKPVLAAVPGDMAAMVADAGAGIAVPPENPEALARAVLGLAALPEKDLIAMGQRGRRLVEEHFCREKLAMELAAILEETL